MVGWGLWPPDRRVDGRRLPSLIGRVRDRGAGVYTPQAPGVSWPQCWGVRSADLSGACRPQWGLLALAVERVETHGAVEREGVQHDNPSERESQTTVVDRARVPPGDSDRGSHLLLELVLVANNRTVWRIVEVDHLLLQWRARLRLDL